MSCPCDRRTFLAGAAIAGVAVAAAGCANVGTVDTNSVPTSKDPSGATTVKASEIPVNGGVVIATDKVVITQPEAGVFKAFSSVCTHAGCSVTEVSNNEIHCPCHGSRFDAATGKVLGGPATAPLAHKSVADNGGTLTLS
ncbi:MAG: Rieske (2Fe-2S) protein [Nocardiaceae bacterium]|nr:Rieske (2Fe-2S) protein [Nocardiaceae bacterium]